MRNRIAFAPLLLLVLASLGYNHAAAQSTPSFQVVKIAPFNRAVPGQIMEIQIDGLGGAPPVKLLPSADFQVEVTQDGVQQAAKVRMVLPFWTRVKNADGSFGEMKGFQNVSFVVPHGLHAGNADITVLYQQTRSEPLKLTVLDRPQRPTIGGPAIMTMSPASLPTPAPGTRMTDLGWRFERDSKAQLFLKPLVDPDDPSCAILIRFKQGNQFYEAPAHVIHQPERTERTARGVGFLPPRDYLEIEIPAALQMGPADMEIKVRANNAESDPIVAKVQIADATRSAEGPLLNAPRLLAVTPRQVGAGQALMLSVDYLRTLNPDPKQTVVVIEHDNARYMLKPETNTALQASRPDAPVMVIARVTEEIIGPAEVRLMNALKGEAGGTSAPISIEIVSEALPPEITSVTESTDADLARLREAYKIQHAAGRPFRGYDPASRYLTIRGRGMDPSPKFIRFTLEQNGQRVTLTQADISHASTDLYIVKLPATAAARALKISVANLGAHGLSTDATATLELLR
jgi:hypothetical protein